MRQHNMPSLLIVIALVVALGAASSCAINHVYLNRGEDGQLGQQKTVDAELDSEINSEITGIEHKQEEK